MRVFEMHNVALKTGDLRVLLKDRIEMWTAWRLLVSNIRNHEKQQVVRLKFLLTQSRKIWHPSAIGSYADFVY